MNAKILIALLLLLPASVFSQQALIRKADKQYARHNYVRAATLWQTAFNKIEDTHNRRHLAFRIGSAMHRMNRLEEAIQWYSDALGEEASNPDWLLAKADAELRSGNTAAARQTAARVLIIRPASSEAKLIIRMADTSEKTQELKGSTKIIYASGINSRWSDYSPSWINEHMVISSTRPADSNSAIDKRSSEYFSKLYILLANLYGDYGKATPLAVRNNSNAGTLSYDPHHNRIFFTLCNNNRRRCTIMQADFESETFRFGRPKPAAFTKRKHNYGHPFVTEDGQTMYFSARLPDGYGGSDIYSISLKPDGTFGIPKNLGDGINTAFDELFPTAAGDSILFFSSYGHPGYGGLDILYSKKTADTYLPAKPLLPPFNSASDDFGLQMKTGTTSGAFSSARNRSTGDDIFLFDTYPIQKIIYGTVRRQADHNPISDAIIQINDLPTYHSQQNGSYTIAIPDYLNSIQLKATHPDYKTAIAVVPDSISDRQEISFDLFMQAINHIIQVSGKVSLRETKSPVNGQEVILVHSDGSQSTTLTGKDGIYRFDELYDDQMYVIRIEREGYFNESRVIRIPTVDRPTLFQKSNGYDLDFELTSLTVKQEITLQNIYYDFDQASLRESSKQELTRLASMMRQTPEVRIKIGSHTDSRGSHAYNDRLSAARAQSVVDYLIQSGIAASRLEVAGYGKRVPVIPNAITETQHQENRRTTFQVIDLTASPMTVPATATTTKGLSFRIQLLVTSTARKPEQAFGTLQHAVGELEFFETYEAGKYRYEAGTKYTLQQAEALRNAIQSAGFPDAFIVPYIDKKRVSMQQAKDYKP